MYVFIDREDSARASTPNRDSRRLSFTVSNRCVLGYSQYTNRRRRSWALVKAAGVAASITNARSGKEAEEKARTGPPTVSLPTCRPSTAMGVRLDLRLVQEPLDRLEALHGFVA